MGKGVGREVKTGLRAGATGGEMAGGEEKWCRGGRMSSWAEIRVGK